MKFVPLVLLALILPALPAHAAVGDWGKGQRAEARLIASGIGKDGKLAAGIEIALPDGWTTYWRTPGDAGVAPVIDFTGSTNVGPAEISFPVPARTDEGGGTITNVYRDHIILPVSMAVPDRAQPIALSLNLHIGACNEICVPEDISLALTVPAGEFDDAAEGTLAEARALLPGPPQPNFFEIRSISRTGGTDNRPVFTFSGIVPDAMKADVFVEGPADWAAYTPEYVASTEQPVWTVKFSRTGSKIPIEGARFRLTIRSAGHAIDQTISLD